MKRQQLSPPDFELAWRLRPRSWDFNGLRSGRDKDKAYAVLVEGSHMKDIYDHWSWSVFEDRGISIDQHVSKNQLQRIVREVIEQFFVRVG